jgi:D-alanyl-D-alanine carboxypeptidase
MIGRTKRTLQQARPITVRGPSRTRARHWPRAPFGVALLLCLLAFAAPDLTLAPQPDDERRAAAPRPVDAIAVTAAELAAPTLGEERTAGAFLPVTAAKQVDTAPFAAALDAALDSDGADGATFAVVRDGVVIWAGAAGRSVHGVPLGPDATFVIGSVTKTFVAATILQLVDEGLLELDESVREHLPELVVVDREITVRQLLDHTSGLADLFNDTTRLALELEPSRAWEAREILATLHPPWYEPGVGWAYANTNYYLLGMIIERLADASLADELEARFLGPMRLDRTRLLDRAADDLLGSAWATIFWASGAMSSSAADLARWGDALYDGGLLEPEQLAAMLRMNGNDYGLGAQRIEVRDVVGHGHTGLLDRYTSLLWHVPDHDVTIALLVNRTRANLGAMLTTRPDGGPSLLDLVLRVAD